MSTIRKQRMPVIYSIRQGKIARRPCAIHSKPLKPYVPTTRLDKWVWDTLLSGKVETPSASSSSSVYASSGANTVRYTPSSSSSVYASSGANTTRYTPSSSSSVYASSGANTTRYTPSSSSSVYASSGANTTRYTPSSSSSVYASSGANTTRYTPSAPSLIPPPVPSNMVESKKVQKVKLTRKKESKE
jgi:hypothetical protein